MQDDINWLVPGASAAGNMAWMNKCEPIESQWEQCGAFKAPLLILDSALSLSPSAYEWQLQRRIMVAVLNTHFPILGFANDNKDGKRFQIDKRIIVLFASSVIASSSSAVDDMVYFILLRRMRRSPVQLISICVHCT